MAAFLEVEFTVTLMRLTQSGDYVESGDRMFMYYFAVPDGWASLPDQACQGRASGAPPRGRRCAPVLETPGPAGKLWPWN